MYAAQILGANWEKDVLDGRLDVLSQFRDQYLEIQRQMTQAALDGARARNDVAASGGTGGSGGSSGGGGGSTPIQNQQAYHVLHLVGGYSTSGEASSKRQSCLAISVPHPLTNRLQQTEQIYILLIADLNVSQHNRNTLWL